MFNRRATHLESFRPITRSSYRLMFGKLYFIFKRWCSWHFANTKYASINNIDDKLPYIYAEHRTPILRKLSGLNMQLQYNKGTNLKIACSKINGVVLDPGETLSFWKMVGKPSKRKGYLEGMVLINGDVCSGIGGGLCQLSNLLYWITLHTPLTIKERWRHNYDSFPDSDRTQPFGSGATVCYNYIDLQIENNTPEPFQLLVWIDDTHLFGEWRSLNIPKYSYEVYESEHSINHEWWGGYTRHNTLRRKVHNLILDEVFDEYIISNHAIMTYQPVLPPGAGIVVNLENI